ncbi:transcription factor TFIIIB component B''-like isoform X3 [Cucumis melo var. makuwa]|uniref:Transcription factor TFIIIB component B''-like isoform X3 n=2 Tax=Cucumis melo TaxID=3656 RepID=A0A5A7VKA8_CUCMM|nr:transcription factor TFIIIB component B''-like isoform X3 [Cucumis melo var. makuwa]
MTHRIKKKEIWPETRKVIRSKAMASRKGGSGGGGEGVRSLELELEKMSVEQLRAFKEQTDMEVNLLHDSLNNIRTATSRLDIASAALHDLSLRPQGKRMLVPLTASLYVPGTLDEADKVLVDVGTGDFIEECGAVANVTMDTPSSVTTTPSERPACKYIPKPKMRTAGDTCTQISQPEISNMLPPSPQVISCDTSGVNEASIGTHSDGVLNDSSINFDGYAPVNQDTGTPVNVESFAFDSYGDILVDDFNLDDQDEMLREENRKNDEEGPSTESNISQQQKICPPVGEEMEHSKTSRRLGKKVSHHLDEPEDGVDDNRNFPNEPSSNSDMHGDGYNKNETLKGGRGKKTSTKSSKPSSENEKRTRKRKEVNKAVPDLQAEKRPKKFSHSTRRNRRQVNKVLLETPEDDIDFQKISFRDLIIYHEHKQKLEKKVASTRKSETNQRTDTFAEEIYNDGEENLASEQGKGTDDDEMPDVVDMTSAYFNYQSFMDKTPRTKWSKSDTERFYEAVRQFGTDFCMIQQLFPGKTRRQIKLKFKSEERHHPFRLSDAITNRAKDHSQFLLLIEQLKEAAKEKQESNLDELTENTGDEEQPELSPQTNEEEVEQPEGVEETGKEEFVGGEVHSPLKGGLGTTVKSIKPFESVVGSVYYRFGSKQLRAFKEQTDMEVNLLHDSLNNIRTATSRLDIASAALHDLSLRPQGKRMFVPLTASLYVPGTLDEADKVLVDVGTGYFIEKTMADGKDYCERKIKLLRSNFDQLIEVNVLLSFNFEAVLTSTLGTGHDRR